MICCWTDMLSYFPPQARRMRPTITPVVTTPLARRLLISSSTASERVQIIALVFKDSWSSTHLEEALAQASPLSSWSGFLLTTGRNPSWNLPFIQLLKYLQQSWNLTIRSWPLTQPWSTQTAPSWLTTRPSTTFAAETLMLSALLTLILTGWLDRLSPPLLVGWFGDC